MGVIKSIMVNHFEMKEKRGWDKTFWAFDIHSTILKPNYTYGDIPKVFYPMAKEVLQFVTKLPDVCMFVYTCSHPNEIAEYLAFFETHDIHFEYVNENPEVKTQNNGYGNYDTKPYMNVLFEDKSGFDPYIEWQEVYDLLREKYPDL
jgi:hypothetical protein